MRKIANFFLYDIVIPHRTSFRFACFKIRKKPFFWGYPIVSPSLTPDFPITISPRFMTELNQLEAVTATEQMLTELKQIKQTAFTSQASLADMTQKLETEFRLAIENFVATK